MIRIVYLILLLFLSNQVYGQGKITRPQKRENPVHQTPPVRTDDRIQNQQEQSNSTAQVNDSKNIIEKPRINAPELNCSVEVNSNQVSGVSECVFRNFQNDVSKYMNTTTFTGANLAPDERIKCKLIFTIKEYNDEGGIKGELQIQSFRPVFNSSYETPLLNFKDDNINFLYNNIEPLAFSINSFQNQLTSILNFYAYMIIATDFDSFALKGGEPFWKQMQHIVLTAQRAGVSEWEFGSNNNIRASIYNTITNPHAEKMRELSYQYNRTRLDKMAESAELGRSNITNSLFLLKELYDTAPQSILISIFRETKLDELVSVYRHASKEERNTIYNILSPIYPTKYDCLNRIKHGR